MKLNIGIVGYGNLGKAAEQIILSNYNYNLVAIFSKRIVKSKFNTLVENYENITLYQGKIDIMLLCGSSFGELEKQSENVTKFFDCINTFDNHKKIPELVQKLDKIANDSGHRAIVSCGWDPGIFSVIRAMFFAVSNEPPSVFWGKGISMGHSAAIRKLDHVFDAVSFTIPNKQALKKSRLGCAFDEKYLHSRECFVVADKKYHKQLERQIKNIPNYFKNQPTSIHFVEENELAKLKSKMSHKGEVISNFKTVHGSKCFMDFKLKLSSNPNFTACVMVSYINAIINLKLEKKTGAFTCLDIPIKFLFEKDKQKQMVKNLC